MWCKLIRLYHTTHPTFLETWFIRFLPRTEKKNRLEIRFFFIIIQSMSDFRSISLSSVPYYWEGKKKRENSHPSLNGYRIGVTAAVIFVTVVVVIVVEKKDLSLVITFLVKRNGKRENFETYTRKSREFPHIFEILFLFLIEKCACASFEVQFSISSLAQCNNPVKTSRNKRDPKLYFESSI